MMAVYGTISKLYMLDCIDDTIQPSIQVKCRCPICPNESRGNYQTFPIQGTIATIRPNNVSNKETHSKNCSLITQPIQTSEWFLFTSSDMGTLGACPSPAAPASTANRKTPWRLWGCLRLSPPSAIAVKSEIKL